MQNKLLIFQHVAKTAGSSLAKVFSTKFPLEAQLSVSPGATTSALGTWPIERVADAWSRLSPQQQDSIRFVGGHLRFGVHAIFQRPAQYITVLRDPVERVLSSFFYSIGRHYLMTGEKVTLEDYVFRKRHYDLGLNNYQTRVISGLADLDPFERVTTADARSITDDDLDVAMNNIRNHYLLVGTTEQLPVFLANLAKVMQWPQEAEFKLPRENVTPDRPCLSEIPINVLDEIRKQNSLDIRLYSFVNTLFCSPSEMR